jgi:chromosome segregation ATPase
MQRLETEKDQLRLQVSVLTEQVEAQAEKMAELERLLEEKKRELNKTEESLQLVSITFACISGAKSYKMDIYEKSESFRKSFFYLYLF